MQKGTSDTELAHGVMEAASAQSCPRLSSRAGRLLQGQRKAQFEGHQAGVSLLIMFVTLCFVQSFNRLYEAHPPEGKPPI